MYGELVVLHSFQDVGGEGAGLVWQLKQHQVT